jgi:hypothetical protein
VGAGIGLGWAACAWFLAAAASLVAGFERAVVDELVEVVGGLGVAAGGGGGGVHGSAVVGDRGVAGSAGGR